MTDRKDGAPADVQQWAASLAQWLRQNPGAGETGGEVDATSDEDIATSKNIIRVLRKLFSRDTATRDAAIEAAFETHWPTLCKALAAAEVSITPAEKLVATVDAIATFTHELRTAAA